MAKFIVENKILDALCDAGVIKEDPQMVKRIVIDLQAGHVGVMYVETFLDDPAITLALAAGLEVVETAEAAGRL